MKSKVERPWFPSQKERFAYWLGQHPEQGGIGLARGITADPAAARAYQRGYQDQQERTKRL